MPGSAILQTCRVQIPVGSRMAIQASTFNVTLRPKVSTHVHLIPLCSGYN